MQHGRVVTVLNLFGSDAPQTECTEHLFAEEYRKFLHVHGITMEEKYIWMNAACPTNHYLHHIFIIRWAPPHSVALRRWTVAVGFKPMEPGAKHLVSRQRHRNRTPDYATSKNRIWRRVPSSRRDEPRGITSNVG